MHVEQDFNWGTVFLLIIFPSGGNPYMNMPDTIGLLPFFVFPVILSLYLFLSFLSLFFYLCVLGEVGVFWG